jgi:hypothetical protein
MKLAENQYIYEVSIDFGADSSITRRILKWINAQWGWFPTTIKDQAPEKCKEAHYAVHCSERIQLLVTVDKYGNRKYKLIT